jgi:uncharacterized membrane protein YphA (DoxX/SURF4 family)
LFDKIKFKAMSILDKLIRWFVGLLFIFSGLVKLNDPMGTAIKMEEYFEVFATDIWSIFHYLVPLAMAIGLFVVILEVLLGVALLINYQMKITSWVLLLLIIFFTFLTFYSAQFNKVTDCGCFGDAIPLTPWQSFSKDIVLLVLIIYIFNRKDHFKPSFNLATGSSVIGITLLLNIFLAYYAIEHLPPIDFRPYKIGADINASMKPSADYIYKYIMEKDGETFEFVTYPSEGGYEFVEMILLNPEAEPKITDYNVWNDEGDYTEESLSGVKLLVLFPDVNKARLKKIPDIIQLSRETSYILDSWVLTANNEADYENFRHEHQFALPYYYVDGTVIKAMVRANPGLILLKDGVVLGKWHNNDIPTKNQIVDLINDHS